MSDSSTHIGRRILYISQKEGISIRAIEVKAGTSQGVLSKIVKNGGDLKCSIADRILELFPHYTTEWFVRGIGSPLKSDQVTVETPEPVVSALFKRIDEQAVENARLNAKIDKLLKQNYKNHTKLEKAAEPEQETPKKNS